MDHNQPSQFPEPQQGQNPTHHRIGSHRLSPNERIRQAMDILQQGRLSLLMALTKVLDPSETDFAVYRDRFYACPKDQPTGKLGKLLDMIYNDPRGRSQLLAWMVPPAVERVTKKIHGEMDVIKDILQLGISLITPKFLVTWDITSTAGDTICTQAPVLSEVLRSATQT